MRRSDGQNNLVDFADQLAQQLVDYADQNGMSAKELIVGLVMTERLLQRVFPGPRHAVFHAVLEGHATFDALIKTSSPQEAN